LGSVRLSGRRWRDLAEQGDERTAGGRPMIAIGDPITFVSINVTAETSVD